MTNNQPATEKQLAFLGKLVKERGLPMPHVAGRLAASQLIDQLLKAEKPTAAVATATAVKHATSEVAAGYYVRAAGTIATASDAVFKVQWNKAQTHQYVKALVQTLDGIDWEWDYRPGYLNTVASGLESGDVVPLTLEKAKELGHIFGHCVICGHKLTVEESVLAGIGPVCAKKLS